MMATLMYFCSVLWLACGILEIARGEPFNLLLRAFLLSSLFLLVGLYEDETRRI
uniref:Uncharacterized protein n=1 Tax=viral metagenome TaxID=1070528 RepID=A0A6M3LE71_9ZZZZ